MLGRPFCGLRFAIYDFRYSQTANRKPQILLLDKRLRHRTLLRGHAHEIHAVGEHLDRTKNGNLL